MNRKVPFFFFLLPLVSVSGRFDGSGEPLVFVASEILAIPIQVVRLSARVYIVQATCSLRPCLIQDLQMHQKMRQPPTCYRLLASFFIYFIFVSHLNPCFTWDFPEHSPQRNSGDFRRHQNGRFLILVRKIIGHIDKNQHTHTQVVIVGNLSPVISIFLN